MKHGLNVTVFEASGRPGGVVQSEDFEGRIVERGPHTMVVTHEEVQKLLEDLHITGRVTKASPLLKKRYIVRRGVPIAAPTSLWSFLTSSLLSPSGKLRIAAEYFVRRGGHPAETVQEFAERRFGKEAFALFFDPLVSGIYAGDPAFLCLASALPKLSALEQTYGSVIAGMVAGGKRVRRVGEIPRSRAQVISFDGGLRVLPDSLARELGQRLVTNAPIVSIHSTGEGWRVSSDSTDLQGAADKFDEVVCALPAHRLVSLFPPLAALQDALPPYASVGSLSLVYDRRDVQHPLDGFGMLIPASEAGRFLLGVIFTSSIFPQRVGTNEVMVTALFGGARHQERVGLDDAEIVRSANLELTDLLGISAPPHSWCLTRWNEGIPQFGPRHPEFLRRLRAVSANHPGLHIIGNFAGGVSLADVVTYALTKADEITSSSRS
jgi:oxygen-dependent protoporphyrinogen oxidase